MKPVLARMGGLFGMGMAKGGGASAPATMRGIALRTGFPEAPLSSSNPWCMSETRHVLTDNATNIEVWFPNFYVSGDAETGSGATATATAQISYTDKDTAATVVVYPIDKTGGTTALSAVDGGFFKLLATINAAAGSRITIQFRVNCPSPTGFVYAQQKADLANGDKCYFGTTAPPALGGTVTNSFAGGLSWYGPCLIAGMSSKPVALLCGDSNDDGLRDVPNTARGDQGAYARLFGPAGIAYVRMSARGASSLTYSDPTKRVRRTELIPYATFAAIQVGINDLGAGRTETNIVTNMTTFLTAANLPGAAIWSTLPPRTTGGISTPWSSSGNQDRLDYNALVRAKPIYFDLAYVLENPASAWASAALVYTDYLHMLNVATQYAAVNGALVGVSAGVHGVSPRAAGAIYT